VAASHTSRRIGVGLVVADQLGEVASDHLDRRAFEERPASGVDVLDPTIAIDRHDGIRRCVENRF
jgi:hypothetical protein